MSRNAVIVRADRIAASAAGAGHSMIIVATAVVTGHWSTDTEGEPAWGR